MLLEEEIAALTAQGVEIPARLLEVVNAIRDACGNALEVRTLSSTVPLCNIIELRTSVKPTAHCCAEGP